MQKIGIDCRFSGVPTGLGRYTRELVPPLVRQVPDVQWVLFVRSKDELWLKDLPKSIQIVTADIPHYSLAEQTTLPKIIKVSGIDELFVPHFNVPFRCPVPFTVVVHDLILHRYPNQSSFVKRFAYRFLMKHAVKNAKSIISVSEFTASEIQKYYHQDSTTVTEAVSAAFAAPNPPEIERVQQVHFLPEKYFLYVGNAKQHKNVQVLISAFVQAALKNTALILVSPGPEAAALQLPSTVRRLTNVPDEDLPVLYAKAQAFMTASLYEGFCLPVLEALSCDCPVIAANTSAIPELAAEGVVLVEPTAEAFTAALLNFSKPKHVAPPTRTWEQVAAEVWRILGVS